MDEYCFDCVKKHIGQAVVLMNEVTLGYPEYEVLVIGNLAEAERESPRHIASYIRDTRIKYMEKGHIDTINFINNVLALWGQYNEDR